MSELVKTQPTFEFNDTEGTMVGFWSPPSMKGLALAGWHLHFLTNDGKAGGHVLEFTTDAATMQLDRSLEFSWLIPDTREYQQHQFTYSYDQFQPFRTPEELFAELSSVRAKGVNYLLAIGGPRGDGSIPEINFEILRKVKAMVDKQGGIGQRSASELFQQMNGGSR
jgi:alpha-L-fucosidase